VSPDNGSPTPDSAALQILRSAARRSSVARRFVPDAERQLLQSIVDATVRLFDAEAASVALFERDPDRLEFKVAAGPRGAGAIGMSVPPTKGIVGYVYSTGQALALSDVGSDPRFDRKAAERTGYTPRSIAAVPLLDGDSTVGVLQLLDKRDSPSFTLRDVELLGVFAQQAGIAIAASRLQREMPALLAASLREMTDGELDEAGAERLVGAVAADLDTDEASPFWRLVELVSQLRALGDQEMQLVTAILEVVAQQAQATRSERTRARRR
jgi:GAF domain-containing protein